MDPRDAVFADHEPTLVAECAKLRFRRAKRVVDYWCQRADAYTAETDDQRQRDRAHLHASPALDSEVMVNGVLDPIGGTIVLNDHAASQIWARTISDLRPSAPR